MSDLPPLWVINLERASDRRESVSAAFAALELPFEFVDAVDGRALTSEQRARYSHRRAVFETGRGLSRGMFGCSLSHLQIYERMLDEHIPVVAVFEDDVIPHPDLRSILESIERLPDDWQVVTLHSLFATSDPQPVDGADLVDGRHVCTYRGGVFGTQGYLINQSGARQVLEVASPVAFPPDELLYRRHPAGLVRYGIEPSVLVHDGEESSEIHSRAEGVVASSRWQRPIDRSVATAGRVWRRLARSA